MKNYVLLFVITLMLFSYEGQNKDTNIKEIKKEINDDLENDETMI